MSERRERGRRILDGFDAETRAEIIAVATEETSATKLKVMEFLANLDANDRDRLKHILTTAFEQYVTELPGPNEFVKSKIRPGVETAAENAVNDWCSWER